MSDPYSFHYHQYQSSGAVPASNYNLTLSQPSAVTHRSKCDHGPLPCKADKSKNNLFGYSSRPDNEYNGWPSAPPVSYEEARSNPDVPDFEGGPRWTGRNRYSHLKEEEVKYGAEESSKPSQVPTPVVQDNLFAQIGQVAPGWDPHQVTNPTVSTSWDQFTNSAYDHNSSAQWQAWIGTSQQSHEQAYNWGGYSNPNQPPQNAPSQHSCAPVAGPAPTNYGSMQPHDYNTVEYSQGSTNYQQDTNNTQGGLVGKVTGLFNESVFKR
ncbi:uncharacterized protein L199_007028 [Kwoniella botswanensis]|uniref:uncharacterized protein n=1 Tax=Kwoniella botswanensis TaxID=1268659 RepID=UPI00315CEB89